MIKMSYVEVEVFRVDAYNRSPADVAREFARTYWDEPREFIWTKTTEPHEFRMVDGLATYQVLFVPGVHLVSRPVYKIIRLPQND